MTFRPKKSLGQHFLKDPVIVHKMMACLKAEAGDRVIEIGTGTGAMTGPLFEKYPDFHTFDVDERAIQLVRKKYPAIKAYHQDFLKTTPDFLQKGSTGRLILIGNIPYFLTGPILFHVIDEGMRFSQTLLMIQEEVAQRLIASPRTKAYGILSVQAQVLGRVRYLFPVSRHVFNPPPKVESAVIEYTPGNERFPHSTKSLPVPLTFFKKIIRMAFQQRRKKISNALKPLFPQGLPPGFDGAKRAEEFEPHVFVDLAAAFYSDSKGDIQENLLRKQRNS